MNQETQNIKEQPNYKSIDDFIINKEMEYDDIITKYYNEKVFQPKDLINIFNKKKNKLYNKLKNKSIFNVLKENKSHIKDFLKLDFKNIKYILPYIFEKPGIPFDYYVARQTPYIRYMIDLSERIENVYKGNSCSKKGFYLKKYKERYE